ncbi:MAG: YvcK family protein [Microthrixaceae bacterium]|nr:YvcK family protein [Microthrixaceae bacterium]
MGVNVVAIGGGHGLSATLRAVRRYADGICGVVTVGDDGGSTGRLRRAGWHVVPGDLRKSLVALAPPDSLLAAGMEHRFEGGELAGHTAGNLLLGAMMRESGGDLIQVLDALGDALGTVGRVLPAAVNPVTLLGETPSGWVRGQVEVAATSDLVRLGFDPGDPVVPDAAVDAIVNADQVILGPGSLYTSVLAAAAVPGIRRAVARSTAQVVYVANLAAHEAESAGYDVADHVAALANHGLEPDAVLYDPDRLSGVAGVEAAVGEQLTATNPSVHDPERLAEALGGLIGVATRDASQAPPTG